MKTRATNRGTKTQRNFPRETLEEALKVPLALKKNGGNPWPPEDIAKAIGLSHRTTRFFYLTAAARDYGLTEGTRDAAQISLTPLGNAVVFPDSSEAELTAKRQAFTHVKVFNDVLALQGEQPS